MLLLCTCFTFITKPFSFSRPGLNPPVREDLEILELQLEVEFIDEEVIIEKGDIRIDAHQFNSQFIHAVLQPQMEDSYFSWNFFDSYLQQKEYFSAYVFVDKIDEILTNNPALKSTFETRKLEDLDFRNSEAMQLHYLYQNSPYFEQSYMRLPVYFID